MRLLLVWWVFFAALLTLVIIFLLLYLNFRRLSETLIVMLSVPFSLVGGIWLIPSGGVDGGWWVVDFVPSRGGDWAIVQTK